MQKISLKPVEGLTAAACHKLFIRRGIARNLSPKTIELYKVHFKVFSDYLSSECAVSEIKQPVVE